MQTLYAIVQLWSNIQLENGNLHYNHGIEAKLVQVMNTKVVPYDILNLIKVPLRPHKHFIHWSHIMASIYMHIAIITCNKSKVIEITLHMLMLMDAQMMLMLMNASAQSMLNTRVLHEMSQGTD